MITRGIVESLVDRYTVKVRMPLLNRMGGTASNVLSEDLNEAVICTLPQVAPNVNVGDVVFVAFEDNNFGKPVVIGYLYRENIGNSKPDMVINSLSVDLSAHLTEDTTIGDVTSEDIKHLKNTKNNLQLQIDELAATSKAIQDVIDYWKDNGDPKTLINDIRINGKSIPVSDHIALFPFDEYAGVEADSSNTIQRIFFKYLRYAKDVSTLPNIPTDEIEKNIGKMYRFSSRYESTDNVVYNVGDVAIYIGNDNNTNKFIKLVGSDTITIPTGSDLIDVNVSSSGYQIVHKGDGNKSSTNTNRTYIQSIETDNCGHIKNISTATETVEDTHYRADILVGGTPVSGIITDPQIQLKENNNINSSVKIKGSGNTTVTSDGTDIIINSDVSGSLSFDGVYNPETNKVATVATVTNKINELDSSTNNNAEGINVLTNVVQVDGKLVEVDNEDANKSHTTQLKKLAQTANVNDLLQTSNNTFIINGSVFVHNIPSVEMIPSLISEDHNKTLLLQTSTIATLYFGGIEEELVEGLFTWYKVNGAKDSVAEIIDNNGTDITIQSGGFSYTTEDPSVPVGNYYAVMRLSTREQYPNGLIGITPIYEVSE